ncbi:5-hydroxytryptamine receptor 1B-like [Lingula anatina]|uniref:5-hydroxytryptamine receptor 1B-like n=1 Tax=Lingula anatina TaxID=7574 RepID=A0A1S3IEP6_LINAN|nr:5-hydroxytryptamine receptor 1B-like [Lingula anatina]XP_013395935.1 5-hydroxytryptamine receptor 1B-like [Lingula anatina]XP_013395936.1 5-hydroxytryptamine receptor 1B-like [Lingula anatina]|eukprot:XP_013395934.1 5-hydroxytryptamine receptor 1B-like [Lingula anatina]
MENSSAFYKNSTDSSEFGPIPVSVSVIVFIVLILCIVIGGIGNFSTMVTIVRLPDHPKSSYYLIASISATHSLLCFFVMPVHMASLLVEDHELGGGLCDYSAYAAAILTTTANLLLCATALQRYISTMHPSCFGKVKSSKYTRGMIALSYLLPLMLFLVIKFAVLDEAPEYTPMDLNCKIATSSLLNFLLPVLYAPSTLIMLCSYLMLFYKIKKMRSTVAPVQDNLEVSTPTPMNDYIVKYQLRLTKTIFLILTEHCLTAICPGFMWLAAANSESDPRVLSILAILLMRMGPVFDVIIILVGNKFLRFRIKNLYAHIFGYDSSDPNSINWAV